MQRVGVAACLCCSSAPPAGRAAPTPCAAFTDYALPLYFHLLATLSAQYGQQVTEIVQRWAWTVNSRCMNT